MGLYSGGLIIGRIFAPEILGPISGGPIFFLGGGGGGAYMYHQNFVGIVFF